MYLHHHRRAFPLLLSSYSSSTIASLNFLPSLLSSFCHLSQMRDPSHRRCPLISPSLSYVPIVLTSVPDWSGSIGAMTKGCEEYVDRAGNVSMNQRFDGWDWLYNCRSWTHHQVIRQLHAHLRLIGRYRCSLKPVLRYPCNTLSV